jgi:ribosomal protein L11 methylase PrmA
MSGREAESSELSRSSLERVTCSELTWIPAQCLPLRTTGRQTTSRTAPFDMIIGNMIDDSGTRDRAGYEKYDIVTANILADILVPMTPAVVPAMKKGGLYITSGILEDQAWKVLNACRAADLEIVEQTQQGEWVSITARKPD